MFESRQRDLFPPPSNACTILLDSPFKQNIFRYTKPTLSWGEPYSITLGYINTWGILIHWGVLIH